MSAIASRQSWGACFQDGDLTLTGLATGVRIHHTVGSTLPEDATIAQEQAEMRNIETTGQTRFSTGISYNVVIFPSGRAYQGASWTRRGTHDEGENTTTRAICFAGNFDVHQPTDAAIRTAASIVAEGRGKWWTPTAPVTGHRDHYPTACPGQHVYDRLGEIRSGSITEETDMDNTQAKQLANVNAKVDALWKWNGGGGAATEFWRIRQQLSQLQATTTAQAAAIEALAASQGLDGPAITQAVTDAVHDALEGLEVTLATKEA